MFELMSRVRLKTVEGEKKGTLIGRMRTYDNEIKYDIELECGKVKHSQEAEYVELERPPTTDEKPTPLR